MPESRRSPGSGPRPRAVAQRIEAPLYVASALETLARLAASEGDWERAAALAHECLAIRIEREMALMVPGTLDVLAEIAIGRDRPDEAARILGAARRLRDDLGLLTWVRGRADDRTAVERPRTA